MQRQVVEGEREAYDQIIHTGENAEADNGKAGRGDHCPQLACLVIVVVIVVVIEGLVQDPDANGADDHRDENRVDIPAEERILDDVGSVAEVGRVNLDGIGGGAVDEQVGGDAGEVSQRRPHCHPDRWHADLERQEQQGDANPLRPSKAHFPQNAN
ncbi:MAG TPA: hypothetical protein VMG13_22160 [Trebonia sp.]|nr:hypothetical protein [Trebonia sp.]